MVRQGRTLPFRGALRAKCERQGHGRPLATADTGVGRIRICPLSEMESRLRLETVHSRDTCEIV